MPVENLIEPETQTSARLDSNGPPIRTAIGATEMDREDNQNPLNRVNELPKSRNYKPFLIGGILGAAVAVYGTFLHNYDPQNVQATQNLTDYLLHGFLGFGAGGFVFDFFAKRF